VVTGQMTSLAGCAGEDFSAVLTSLGYVATQRPGPAITVPLAAPAAQTKAGEAPQEQAGAEAGQAATGAEAAAAAPPPPPDDEPFLPGIVQDAEIASAAPQATGEAQLAVIETATAPVVPVAAEAPSAAIEIGAAASADDGAPAPAPITAQGDEA